MIAIINRLENYTNHFQLLEFYFDNKLYNQYFDNFSVDSYPELFSLLKK